MGKPTSRPGRRSGDALQAAIRHAIRSEMEDRGYGGLTFDGVAKRAQTSKPVIYRRYRSRAHMAIDAWSDGAAHSTLPTASTGALRDDLITLGRAVVARLHEIGADTLRRLIADVDNDLLPQFNAITWDSAQHVLGAMIDDARARGEITQDPLPMRVILIPITMLRHELLFNDHIDDATLTDIIDTVCLPLMTQGSQ